MATQPTHRCRFRNYTTSADAIVVRAVRDRCRLAGTKPPAANTVRARMRCVRANLDARARKGAGSAAVRRLTPAAGRMPPTNLLLDLRSILLDVAGAEVQHRASRRAPGKKGTLLLSTVMQWSADQRCGAEMAHRRRDGLNGGWPCPVPAPRAPGWVQRPRLASA